MDADQKKLGVVACTAIVAGNMMGSGIALLPANLASIGSISIIGWGVALVGALALAYVFSRLSMEDPQEGGPIAYAGEVSPILGYQAGLLYYHANWIGNVAIAITGVDYLSVDKDGFISPDELKEKIYYDENDRKLFLIGWMTEAERDTLCDLMRGHYCQREDGTNRETVCF